MPRGRDVSAATMSAKRVSVLHEHVRARQQRPSGVGQAGAASGALEQRRAELALEREDALADGRLRRVGQRGCAGEAARRGDRQEDSQLFQQHLLALPGGPGCSIAEGSLRRPSCPFPYGIADSCDTPLWRVPSAARMVASANPRLRLDSPRPCLPNRNVLVLMSDEHNPKYLGAAGHPYIQTPNLDALAARGTRFTSAYTTCPICVPARAAFAVGRYVHEIGFWDNGDAYDGSVPELASRAARRRPSRRVDRQAAFSRAARRRSRLHPGDRADARDRGHRRRQGPRARRHPDAQGRRQDGEVRRPRRIDLHRVRPRHRVARADLAARGGHAGRRRAVGAVRVVRRPALSAHGAARVVLPIRRHGPADAQAISPRRATAPSCHRRIRARGRLRHALRRRARRAPRARRLRRPGFGDGRERRQGAARARGCGSRRATPPSSTPAITATTPARAGCGASRRSTRSRPACR